MSERADPEALWRRWRESGDPSALGALFDATAPELFGVALHLCRDPVQAEDALQETYLAALEAPDRFDAGRRVVPWLVGILRNKLHEVRRFDARAADPERAARPSFPSDPVLEATTAEEEERVRRALAELPEPYREVALLRWRHGLEPAEIAELKRMAPGTVRSLLHRALERLRRSLVSLPALLFGGREGGAPRGLAAVRGAVLAGAPAAVVAAGSAVVLGGIVMAKKTVVAAVAAALLLAAGFGAWRMARPGGGDGEAPAGTTTAAAPVPVAPAPAATPPPETASPAITEEAIPPPVDLSKCDRDLDLFGVVVDAKDAPVPGARLSLFDYPLRRGGILVDGMGHWKERAGLTCLSSTDGSFAFRLARGHLTHLRAVKPGLAETVISDCQAGERLKVVMEPPGRLLLRARDGAGAPVAGVRVVLASSWKIYFTRMLRSGVTDAAGRCVFADLPPGRVSVFEAEHERLVLPDHVRFEIPVGGEVEGDLAMAEGRTVPGSVMDAGTGSGIAGARIGWGWPISRPVLSKPDGTFEYPGWLGGAGESLYAVAEGWGRQSIEVPAEGSVEFRLQRGDEAVGRCVAVDGSPVAGAVVCAMGSSREPGRQQQLDTVTSSTGADGRFRLGSLRRDLPHTLVAMAPGHGRTLLDFRPRAEGPGAIDLGDLRLPPARRIEGRVLGPDGAPLADVRVELQGANADRGRLLGEGGRVDTPYGDREIRRTDDLGRFRFPDLAPGRYSVTGHPDGHAEVLVRVELAEKDLLQLELRPPAPGEGHALVVLLVDGTGAPVTGVRVNANQGRGRAQKNSGADGTARFEGLKPGYVSVTTYDMDTGGAPRFLNAQAQAMLPVDEPLRIALLPRGEVTGTVVGPDGKPVGGFMVCAREPSGDGQPKWYAQVDSEGKFRLDVPPGVPLTVLLPDARTGAGATPYRGQVDGVVAPAAGVLLRVRPAQSNLSLTVELRDAAGAPVGEGHLMILGGGKPQHRAFDSAGRIEMSGLSEDSFHAMIQAPPEPVNSAWTQEVPPAPRDLVPGAGEVVVFQFRKGVPLRGRVVDERGDPVAGAVVSVQTQDYATRWVFTGDDGRFAAPVLPGEKLRSFAAEKRTPDGKAFRCDRADFLPGDAEVEMKLVPLKME